MPLILPGNVASALPTGYDIDNSCRFNGTDEYMDLAHASSGSTTTWTFSFWIKRGKLGAVQRVYGCDNTAGSLDEYIFFDANDLLKFNVTHSGGSEYLVTNRKFRDVSAWYHIVCTWDTTNATEADRMRIYVNGTRETSFSSSSLPAEDLECTQTCNSGTTFEIMRSAYGGGEQYVSGYLAEFIFCSNNAYAASNFGEFDEDSPTIWKPKAFGDSFGNAGFHFDFEASDNLGNDANGGTDATEYNLAAANQATDTPTNNFCTMNPLDNFYQEVTFSEGMNRIAKPSSPDNTSPSKGTIGLTAGKWYWELKCSVGATTSWLIGIGSTQVTAAGNYELGVNANDYAYSANDGDIRSGGSESSYGDTYAAGDIIGVALDLANSKLYFAKNGTWQNSGDPTSGATGTGATSITAVGSTINGHYFPSHSFWSGTGTATTDYNFGGCPAFSISSGNADGNGYGNFEYAPPSGYLAICTKNLGSDGG